MMDYLQRKLGWMGCCIRGDLSNGYFDGNRSMGTIGRFEAIHSHMRHGEDIIELPRRPYRRCVDVEDMQPYNSSILSLNSSVDSIDDEFSQRLSQVEATRSELAESKRAAFRLTGWKSLKRNQAEAVRSSPHVKDESHHYPTKMSKTPPASQTSNNIKATDLKSPKKPTTSPATKKIPSLVGKRRNR